MENAENKWDKLLKIKTSGRDDSSADQYRYPYEPTPYVVLERLANSGYIGKNQVLIDYGCGKGRVDFFLSYQTRCRSVGIEYDDHIYAAAMANAEAAVSANRVRFCHQDAAQYQVKEADRFYFFNPFSVEILKKVIHRILESYYENPREMMVFFYYPSDEYVSYLMTVDEMMFSDEIDCKDLFDGNDARERIMVFEL